MKRITKIEAAQNSVRKKRRVAAYARVSTDSDKQLMSLDIQKNYYERYIKARPDWEFAGLYYDEGVSGTLMAKRDGLLRMRDDCNRGLIDYLIVKSVSRFSRNTVESIETVRKLSDKGIYIYFEKENINHEANDNLWHDLEKNPDQATTDKEILESEQAQTILPFLTLDKLANHEKAEILSYATESVVMAKNDDFPGGKYFNMLQVEKNVAGLANEGDSWENGAISPKLRQARKLFCAALFDACNDKDSNQTKNAIYSSFFAISPNITSYNGLISVLELLPIAERTSHNPCSKALQFEAVNDEYNI